MKMKLFASLVATIFIAACGHEMVAQPAPESHEWTSLTIGYGFGYGYSITTISADGTFSRTSDDDIIDTPPTESQGIMDVYYLNILDELISEPSLKIQSDITLPENLEPCIGGFLEIYYAIEYSDGSESSFSIDPAITGCYDELIPQEISDLKDFVNRSIAASSGCD